MATLKSAGWSEVPHEGAPTTRPSATTGLRAVRGVLPRSFPGVLKVSAKFLMTVSYPVHYQDLVSAEYIRFVLVEDTSHVLVQPVHLISRRVRKLLDLCVDDL